MGDGKGRMIIRGVQKSVQTTVIKKMLNLEFIVFASGEKIDHLNYVIKVVIIFLVL